MRLFPRTPRCVLTLLIAMGMVLAAGSPAWAGDDLTTAAPNLPAIPSPTAASGATPGAASPSGASGAPAASSLPLRGSSRLGREYTEISPAVRTGSPRTIEVTVFSLYACVACANANDVLQKWADNMPYFVKVQNSPAVLNPHWSYLARVFFALDAMGQERPQRPYLFRAITQEGMNYADFHQMERWLDARGVNLPAFETAFDSNDVIAQTANASSVARLYHVSEVPTVVIDGRYLVTVSSAGGLDKLPAVLTDVITRVAMEKGLLR